MPPELLLHKLGVPLLTQMCYHILQKPILQIPLTYVYDTHMYHAYIYMSDTNDGLQPGDRCSLYVEGLL